MLQIIAEIKAEPLYLMSVVKPLLMLAAFGPWAWLVGRLDKDAGYYYLKQNEWGMAHIGAGAMAFVVMIFIPIFWAGWILGIMILAGEISGYVVFRNKEVPADKRWSGKDIIRQVQEEREQKASQKAIVLADVKLVTKDGVPMEVPHGTDPRLPAFQLFQNLLLFAAPRGADRLDIVVDATKAVFNARIDGVRYPQQAPEPELCIQLIDYLKENAGMDLSDRRRKQSGRLGVDVEGSVHELTLTTAGSTKALQLVVEIDPEGRLEIPMSNLGLMEQQYDGLMALAHQQDKVVIFASPPHTGSTTTSYAMLKQHDPYTSSVMTFEKQTPYPLEGVSHNLFADGATNDQIMSQFASLMRADPNVMYVSQVVSPEMAKLIAEQAGETRVYLPLPANDTLSALKIWMKAVGDKKLAGNALGAVVSQRLIRKLCTTCRAPYEPDDVAMKKLNMSKTAGGLLYKASGKVVIKDKEEPCPQCHGLGYRGRIGVFEVMFIDDEARTLIATGEGERLRNHLRKQHMLYLQEAALAKVVEGVTDIKEVTRVMSEHQKG